MGKEIRTAASKAQNRITALRNQLEIQNLLLKIFPKSSSYLSGPGRSKFIKTLYIIHMYTFLVKFFDIFKASHFEIMTCMSIRSTNERERGRMGFSVKVQHPLFPNLSLPLFSVPLVP